MLSNFGILPITPNMPQVVMARVTAGNSPLVRFGENTGAKIGELFDEHFKSLRTYYQLNRSNLIPALAKDYENADSFDREDMLDEIKRHNELFTKGSEFVQILSEPEPGFLKKHAENFQQALPFRIPFFPDKKARLDRQNTASNELQAVIDELSIPSAIQSVDNLRLYFAGSLKRFQMLHMLGASESTEELLEKLENREWASVIA